MHILHIEHAVPEFDAWKKAFDSDPVGRVQGGVRRYRVLRLIDNPNHIMVDLEFDSSAKAEAFLAALRELWRHVEGQVAHSPQARIFEVVDDKGY
jgi:ribosomal protein L35AE/L33A